MTKSDGRLSAIASRAAVVADIRVRTSMQYV